MTAVLRLPLHSGQEIPDPADRDWSTSAELIAQTGISARQLDYWTRTGLLHVLDQLRPGTGFLNRYANHEVHRAMVIAALLESGLSLQAIRDVFDDLIDHGHKVLGRVALVLDPELVEQSPLRQDDTSRYWLTHTGWAVASQLEQETP